MTSYARIYAVRIYEDNKLIHEFLPYKNGEVVSLRDTETGYVATKTAKSGVTNPAWPTIGGKGVDGAERWIVAPQSVRLSKRTGTATLSANAAGAVSYRWTRNGEPVAGGEDGNLAVEWETSKTDTAETYAVIPVYDVLGTAVEGEPVSVSVEFVADGTALIFR